VRPTTPVADATISRRQPPEDGGAPASHPPEVSYHALFAIPSIRRIVFAMTMARLASSMVSVAVILFSLSRYGSPVLTGIVTFASLFPAVLASPLAGALLDRHGRARLVIVDYLIGGAAIALIALLAALDALPPWGLVAIVAVAAVTNPLSNSGVRTLLPVLAPRHLWPRVNAVDANSYVIAQLIGPPLAGVTIGVAGPVVGLTLIGGMLAVAALFTVGIPEPATPSDTSGRLLLDARNGLMYVIRNRTLRGIAIALSALRLGSGIQAIVMPVIVLNVLHAGPVAVGVAWGLSAVGGFVASLIFGRIDAAGRERLILAICYAGTGAGVGLLLFASNIAVVFVAMALTGFLNGPGDVTMFTLRQRRTHPAWFGRAFAVSASFNFAGYPIGSAIGGAVVEHALTAGIVFAIVMSLLAGVLAWILVPQSDADPTLRTSVRN
jgi:MFS family permease